MFTGLFDFQCFLTAFHTFSYSLRKLTVVERHRQEGDHDKARISEQKGAEQPEELILSEGVEHHDERDAEYAVIHQTEAGSQHNADQHRDQQKGVLGLPLLDGADRQIAQQKGEEDVLTVQVE